MENKPITPKKLEPAQPKIVDEIGRICTMPTCVTCGGILEITGSMEYRCPYCGNPYETEPTKKEAISCTL